MTLPRLSKRSGRFRGALFWPVGLLAGSVWFVGSGGIASLASGWALYWPWLIVSWWLGLAVSVWAKLPVFGFSRQGAIWMTSVVVIGTFWTSVTYLVPGSFLPDVGSARDVDLFDLLGEYHDFSESFEWTLEAGRTLDIQNGSGPVRVRASRDGRVRVDMSTSVRGQTREEAAALMSGFVFRLDDLGSVSVVASNPGSLPEVVARRFRTSLDVEVPPETPLRVETVAGRLDVAGLSGPQVLRTRGGDIRARPLGGEFEARTTAGRVRVIFDVAPRDEITLGVRGGDVWLELPSDSEFGITGHVVDGEFTSDFAGIEAVSSPAAGNDGARELRIEGRVGNPRAGVSFDVRDGSVEISESGAWKTWVRRGQP